MIVIWMEYIVCYLGCQSSQVNMEARPIDAKMITRRCIVTKMKEFTMAKYRELIQENAGALLIMLPKNITALSEEDTQVLLNHWYMYL